LRIELTTTGRRSGLPRRVTLYAYEDRDRLVIVGSYGGAAHDPDWAINLRAHPRAQVRRGRQTLEMTAREVDGLERGPLWDLVRAEFPLYETYQARTERVIPLFLLESASDV
jgi:deazaflavin-dependent oxidoreductase (nitroreductase family)